MPALTLNGITIPIARDSGQLSWNVVQDEVTTYDGTLRRTVRSRKRKWEFKTTPQTQSLSNFYRRLMNGEGHYWSYDSSRYSSKGMGPTSETLASNAVFAKYGANSMYLSSPNGAILYPTAYGTSWTAIFWKYSVAGTWQQWILINNAGSKSVYVNGVVSTLDPAYWFPTHNATDGNLNFIAPQASAGVWTASTAISLGTRRTPTSGALFAVFYASVGGTTAAAEPTWPMTEGATVVDGTVTWRNIGRRDLHIDDLTFLPYAIPTTWVTPLYTEHNIRALSALPLLNANGTMIQSGPITVMASPGDADIMPYAGNLAAERLSFTLSES